LYRKKLGYSSKIKQSGSKSTVSNLQDILKKITNEWPKAVTESFTNHPVANLFRNDFKAEIQRNGVSGLVFCHCLFYRVVTGLIALDSFLAKGMTPLILII